MYYIKANEKLFYKLKKMNTGLEYIVQNDHTLNDQQVKEWREKYMSNIKNFHDEYMKKVNEFTGLMKETILYLERCKKYE